LNLNYNIRKKAINTKTDTRLIRMLLEVLQPSVLQVHSEIATPWSSMPRAQVAVLPTRLIHNNKTCCRNWVSNYYYWKKY